MKWSIDGEIKQLPAGTLRIKAIEMHTGGEPLRVIIAGLPPIEGHNVLEKRRWFRENYDHLRTGLMFEPRGHADMYGAVVTEAEDDADFDVFFLHNEGYSTMCGHAIIALTKLIVDAGLIKGREVSFNVPAGRVLARARVDAGVVLETSFRNVPSFVLLRDRIVEVPGLGQVRFDVAYGGAFYAIVDAAPFGLELIPENHARLIDTGRRIRSAVVQAFTIAHPFEPDLSFLYGTIFTAPARIPTHHSRNVCIFADGELDRSATGSGVSARAALHYARGELQLHRKVVIESILGSTMSVEVVEEKIFGPRSAVVPEVSGTAYVTGRSEFFFDPEDPLKAGFIFR
jgi:trans-L-3-hydroxyproline dehydratase